MAFEFAGKAIVVTGGASGIGLGFCRQLVARGARVGVADVELDKATQLADALGDAATAFHVDVADGESVEALADASWSAFGRVDGIFNNAGVGAGRDLIRTKEADFDWIVSVNLKGVWNGCRVFGARFAESETPALILNTGSEHSFGVPHLNAGIYTATKHAVHGMSDVLRREVPPHIQVSLFCPGIVATDIWDARRNRPEEFGGPKASNPAGKALMDMGMTPDDVASRVLDAAATGAFYCVTHPSNIRMIEERSAELHAAFDAQTADIDGDQYDLEQIIARMKRTDT